MLEEIEEDVLAPLDVVEHGDDGSLGRYRLEQLAERPCDLVPRRRAAVEGRRNEQSSAEEEASGMVSVELEGCDRRDTLRVEFKEVVPGSAYHDLPSLSLSVEGEVVAQIGEPEACGGRSGAGSS